MSKGKRNYKGEKEFDELQKLKFENKKLKREISSLRRQAKRNLQNYENVKDLIDLQHEEEKLASRKKSYTELKRQYSCHKCDGYLRIRLLPIRHRVYYKRVCSNHPKCMNMTQKKLYDPERVEGIMESEDKG